MKRYKRIQIEEREEIMKSIAGGKSLREIARKLNRNVSSISREIKRNKKGRKGNKDLRQAQYSANKAQEKAQNRQKERHKKFVLKSYVIREEVERLIMNRWSPELISGRLRKEGIGQISAESIYKWIFNEKRYLIPYLRRYNKDRVYKKRGSYKTKRVDKIKAIVRIDQRPQEINKRTVLGHWETDLVEGKGKASLKVFVERKTRFVKIIKVINKTGEESINATMKVFEKGDYPIHSITYDNGSENSGHTIINNSLSIQSYFCFPYCSWQKGTIENTNGLIRVIFPKQTNFDSITNEQIQQLEDWINNRPKKCLNFFTPKEVFFSSVALAT